MFEEVIENLTSPNRNLKRAMMLCQHACTLLGWDGAQWFNKEIGGYNVSEDIPSYRQISGEFVWRTQAPTAQDTAADMVGLGPDRQPEPTVMNIWHDVDRLISFASTGTTDPIGETKKFLRRGRRVNQTAERVRTFQASTYQDVLNRIQVITFDFASDSCAQLLDERTSIPIENESGETRVVDAPSSSGPTVINIESNYNSPFQLGDGVQSIEYPPLNQGEILALMAKILEFLAELPLSEDDVAAATADIKTSRRK